jgi:hypothetical protein
VSLEEEEIWNKMATEGRPDETQAEDSLLQAKERGFE